MKQLRTYLAGHLSGTERIGVYNLLPDSTVFWMVTEFESHGSRGVKEPGKMCREYQKVLREAGVETYRERSKSGGENYHVWTFFGEAVAAKTARHLACSALAPLDLVEAGRPRVEVFPCRDSGSNSFGTFIWLPYFGGIDECGGKKGYGVKQGCTVFLDGDGQALPAQAFISAAQRHSVSEVRAALSGLDSNRTVGVEKSRSLGLQKEGGPRQSVSVPVVRSEDELLDPLLRNCPRIAELIRSQEELSADGTRPVTQRGISWENWFHVVGVFCHFGRVGETLVHRISARSPKYDSRATQQTIDTWKRKAIPPTTCDTLCCNRRCFPQPSPVRWIYKRRDRWGDGD